MQKVVVTFELDTKGWVEAYLCVSRIFSTFNLPKEIKHIRIENGMEGAKK